MLRLAGLSALLASVGVVQGQGVGTQQTETHPKMTWQKCTAKGSCTNQNGEVVIDANWRWVHDKNGYTNCYTDNSWNSTICSDNVKCASNCVVDGMSLDAEHRVRTRISEHHVLTLCYALQAPTTRLHMEPRQVAVL